MGKNWQTRAWDPVFKTAGSAPDAAMILGLFSQKKKKINIGYVFFLKKYSDSHCCWKKIF
jgi:hypothetical protein